MSYGCWFCFTPTPCCATSAFKKLDADAVIIGPNGFVEENRKFTICQLKYKIELLYSRRSLILRNGLFLRKGFYSKFKNRLFLEKCLLIENILSCKKGNLRCLGTVVIDVELESRHFLEISQLLRNGLKKETIFGK